MGQSTTFRPRSLSEESADPLCQAMLEAVEFMTDDQILCAADALHETLRQRRQMRYRIQQRVEERLCAGGGTPFPF